MTNIFFVSLAYKAAVLQLMLGEANYFSQHLHLPTPHPITVTDIKNLYVNSPRFGFGGNFDTKNFNFSFAHRDGKLCYIQRLKIKDENSILDLYPELASTPSLITTNGAYQLATQWLSSVSIDVSALEQKYKVHFYQWFFWNPLGTTNKCMLPIFEVKWGEGDIPAMEVTILGSTKELMELRMEDDSVSRRPPLIVTNVTELNSDPYPPMKHPQHAVAAQTNSMGLTFDTNTLARPQPIRPESKNE